MWVDLEMTGIDPESDVILEVVAKITDFNFTELAHYDAVVVQSEAALEAMNDWSREHHAASGLTERVRTDGKPSAQVEQELAALIQKYFGVEPAILAGNSIHQDRRFIRQWWPDVEQLLHYRMLDVSALKVYMSGKYDLDFEKKETHRALDDIQESIAEWQYYIDWLQSHKP